MKVRNNYDRILCLFLSLSVAFLFVVCSFRPFTASAIGEVDNIASDIKMFYEDYKRELDRVEQALASDITNGSIDESSTIGKEYMGALALQAAVANDPVLLSVYTLANSYNDSIEEVNKFISYLENNPTITFSGTGGVGLYQISGYNDYRIANMHFYDNAFFSDGKIPLVTSNDFEIYFSLSETSNYSCTASIAGDYFNFGCAGNWWAVSIASSNSLGFTDLNNWGAQNGRYFIASTVPVLTSIPDCPTSGSNAICGNVVSEDLPVDSCPTDSPWIYYNETILPYMQSNFPNVPTNYYLFPTGYGPAEPPTEPTEPTLPSGDLVIPPYGELVTEPSSYYITDESGETITDESGEPITETTMIPVTSATVENGNYLFRVPTLPSIYMTDTGELNISLPVKYASICGSLFSACYDILNSSGILSVLPFIVGMAVVVYVIYKVGG